MKKKYIDSHVTPQILVENSYGPLTIRLSEERAISFKGHDFEAREKGEDGSTYVVENRSGLAIRAPEDTQIHIGDIKSPLTVKGIMGDLTIQSAYSSITLKNVGQVRISELRDTLRARNINGPLTLGEVYGDVLLRNVETLTADALHGDLYARHANGSVTIQTVHGDVALKTVNENVTIQHSGRDVNLRNVGGLVTVTHAEGDIRLLDGLATGKHQLTASGDIIIRWPEGNDLQLDATARQVTCHLPLEIKTDEQTDGRHLLVGHIGEGDTYLTLDSQGEVILKSLGSTHHAHIELEGEGFDIDLSAFEELGRVGEEMGRLGEEWSAQFSEQFADRMAHLSQKLESKLNSGYAENIAAKVERAMERVMRDIERTLHRAERRAATTKPPRAPRPPKPVIVSEKKQKETSDAQLKILQMLENGAISVEEANTLLKAIE